MHQEEDIVEVSYFKVDENGFLVKVSGVKLLQIILNLLLIN